MGTDSVGEVEVSTRTQCVAAEVAGIANLAPPKKPSTGVAMGTKSSSAVGRYIERGSGSSWKKKKRVEENMKIKIIFFFFV